MSGNGWAEVDGYIVGRLLGDDALGEVIAANEAAGLPAIDVSAAQGKLLMLLAKMAGARRILEVGTLGGFSTIWLARGLAEGGGLVTLELDPHHAAVARANVDRAGVGAAVEIRVGPARETLAQLKAEGGAPFDLVFVDADKQSYPAYLEGALALAAPGSTLVFDNVVRDGRVLVEDSDDANVRGIRTLYDMVAGDPRLEATAIQTVGAKGWDGFLVARLRGG